MKNESYHEYLPTVENVNWMIKNGVARCEDYNEPYLDFHVHVMNGNESSIGMNSNAVAPRTPRTIKLIASGISKKEAQKSNSEIEQGMKSTRIKDDLSEKG
jgi:hypothetical protein